MIQNHIPEPLAKVLDWFSFAGAIAFVSGLIPALVGIATFVWTVIRIYEMETTQKIIAWAKTKLSKAK